MGFLQVGHADLILPTAGDPSPLGLPKCWDYRREQRRPRPRLLLLLLQKVLLLNNGLTQSYGDSSSVAKHQTGQTLPVDAAPKFSFVGAHSHMPIFSSPSSDTTPSQGGWI